MILKKMKWYYIAIVLLYMILDNPLNAQGQTHVLLDNYYNHEIQKKTGKDYHYLWSDKASSGFSEWGKIFEENGASIDTLQRAPETNSLSLFDIYIIVDPDTKLESASPHYIEEKDIRVIVSWVKKGGVLVLMANDSANCEFDHLNNLSEKFGIHFNQVSLNHVQGKQWEMGAITDLPENEIFSGVHKIYIKEASSLHLSEGAKPLLSTNGHVFIAINKMGKGYVLAVTDPWIYNEYIDHRNLPESFENMKAAKNFTRYLISLSKMAE